MVIDEKLEQESLVVFVPLKLLVNFLVHRLALAFLIIGFINAVDDLLKSNEILLPVSSALKLIFVFDAVFSHFGADHFPSFAVNREVPHELVMKVGCPEVLTLLVDNIVNNSFNLAYFLF